MLGATGRNRVAKHTSADFPRAVGGVDDAFRFDLLQYSQQIRRFDGSNWFATQIGNDPLVNLSAVASPGSWRQRMLLCHQPFVGDCLKRVVLRGLFLSTTLQRRINTVRQLPPSVIAFLARSLQGNFGVLAESEQLLYPTALVPEPP